MMSKGENKKRYCKESEEELKRPIGKTHGLN